MTIGKRCAFDLIKAAIYKDTLNMDGITTEQWEEAIELLKKNKLLGLTHCAMEALPDEQKPDDEQRAMWKQVTFSTGLMQMIRNDEIVKLLEEGYKRGIKWIVFKGLPIALLYPDPKMRLSCDADIFVDAEQCNEAKALLEEFGFEYNEKRSKEHVHNYYKGDRAAVELHTRLWEDYEGEPTRILDSFELTKEDTLLSVEIQGKQIKTLGYTEHLIYQMFHIIKHFSLEGVGLRYITDVTLYINYFIDKIDMERFWESMDKLYYGKFCDCFFKLAIEYFGLTKEALCSKYAQNEIAEGLFEDIINAGKIGEDDTTAWRVLHMISPYMMWEREKPKSKGEVYKNILFPKKEILYEQYHYCERNKILIPIAWINRICRVTRTGIKRGDLAEDMSFKMDKVNHRLDLMGKTGLINNKKWHGDRNG